MSVKDSNTSWLCFKTEIVLFICSLFVLTPNVLVVSVLSVFLCSSTYLF